MVPFSISLSPFLSLVYPSFFVFWFNLVTEISKVVAGIPSESASFRLSEKGKNLRAILEKFARANNADPHVPDTWYNLSQKFAMLKVIIILFHPLKCKLTFVVRVPENFYHVSKEVLLQL